MDPVRSKQISAVGHSVGLRKESNRCKKCFMYKVYNKYKVHNKQIFVTRVTILIKKCTRTEDIAGV